MNVEEELKNFSPKKKQAILELSGGDYDTAEELITILNGPEGVEKNGVLIHIILQMVSQL